MKCPGNLSLAINNKQERYTNNQLCSPSGRKHISKKNEMRKNTPKSPNEQNDSISQHPGGSRQQRNGLGKTTVGCSQKPDRVALTVRVGGACVPSDPCPQVPGSRSGHCCFPSALKDVQPVPGLLRSPLPLAQLTSAEFALRGQMGKRNTDLLSKAAEQSQSVS